MHFVCLQITLSLNGTGDEKGDLHFSLFRGAHSISPRISSSAAEPDTNEYLICEFRARFDHLKRSI